MRKFLIYIIVCSITVLLILNPEKSVYYARESLSLCADIIIPSLFPFFVCSGLLIYSGFCEILAKLFSPVMKPLFNINPAGASAFILGIISGYPLGAVTACQLYRGFYLSKSEAERLLAFCNNSGPLFIMGAVGVSIYHSTQAGIILYIAHILGALTVGILSRFYKYESYHAPQNKISTMQKSIPEVFKTVIANSLQSILTVCATVVFCSVISNIVMDLITMNETAKAFLNGIMEFVSGLNRVSYLDTNMISKLLMSAWICAFAGISVHLQVMSVVGDTGLSLKPYITGKILHAFFAVFYTFIILKIIPVTQTVFSHVSDSQRISGGFFVSSLFAVIGVLLLCVIAVLYLSHRLKKQFLKFCKNQ